MGSKKVETTQTNSVQAASPEEAAFRKLMLNFAGGATGDYQKLSMADIKLTPEDMALIEQAVGSQTKAATDMLRSDFALQNAGLSNQLSSTGQTDSSIELARRIMQGGEQARALESVRLSGAQMGAQYGMQLPFQRINAGLAMNSQALARMGVANPALQSLLQERLANSTQTGTQTSSGFSIADFTQMLGSLPSIGKDSKPK